MNLVEALKEGGRSGTAGVGRQYLRRTLVAAEVAFSLMLLAAAGLLTQSLVRLQKQAPGIREDHLLKAHFYLPPAHYPNPPAITRFCERFAEKIRSLPGVINGTVTTVYPPNDRWAQIFSVEGQTPPDSQELPTTRFGVTDERYLRTLGIPLLQGRDFDPSDTEWRPAVALINREFAARYFRGRNPLGVRIHLGQPVGRTVSAPPNPIAPGAVTVIGVMENFRNNGLAFAIEPQLITLFRQEPSVNFGFKDVVVRTAVDPHRMTRALRRQLQDLDPNLPLAELQTMEEYVSRQTSNERFITSLLGLFAALGLLLTMLGIYGVVSFLVQQRTAELGIRLALGASPFGVLWLVVRQALTLGLAGILVGLCGAALIQKLLSSLLFQVTATDIAGTLLSVCGGLLLMAALASAVPGLRAMRIDAVSALREE